MEDLIQSAFQSAGFSNPISKLAGSDQADAFPSLSQTLTFHQQTSLDSRACPRRPPGCSDQTLLYHCSTYRPIVLTGLPQRNGHQHLVSSLVLFRFFRGHDPGKPGAGVPSPTGLVKYSQLRSFTTMDLAAFASAPENPQRMNKASNK